MNIVVVFSSPSPICSGGSTSVKVDVARRTFACAPGGPQRSSAMSGTTTRPSVGRVMVTPQLPCIWGFVIQPWKAPLLIGSPVPGALSR